MTEQTKTIQGFDPRAFADNLAGQAREVLPKNISKDDADFVIKIVHDFCVMSGEALAADTSVELDADQASFITQIIGEWTFHKSIDLAKAGIDISLREPVLHKVAFTVFEVAKNAIIKRMPSDQVLSLVEHQVTKSFKAAIDELQSKGALDEELTKNALSQSNIDEMAKEEIKKETPHVAMSDTKILKLASLAFLIRNFSTERIKSIISKFEKNEAEVLVQYLKMQDLDKRINPNITAKCLQDMKKHLPEPKVISYNRCFYELVQIAKKIKKERVLLILKEERTLIKDYAISPYTNKKTDLPPLVANLVNKHLKEYIK